MLGQELGWVLEAEDRNVGAHTHFFSFLMHCWPSPHTDAAYIQVGLSFELNPSGNVLTDIFKNVSSK